jgi:hypothetical protein
MEEMGTDLPCASATVIRPPSRGFVPKGDGLLYISGGLFYAPVDTATPVLLGHADYTGEGRSPIYVVEPDGCFVVYSTGMQPLPGTCLQPLP